MFDLFTVMCAAYIAHASTTRFLILVETDKNHVGFGYVDITIDWLIKYCYLDKSRMSLRFNPGKARGREIFATMEDAIEINRKDYDAMVEGFRFYTNKKGEVCKANQGDMFERYCYEVLYGLSGWYHNTRPHIYGGDIPASMTGLDHDIEVKTAFRSTFMEWKTFRGFPEALPFL